MAIGSKQCGTLRSEGVVRPVPFIRKAVPFAAQACGVTPLLLAINRHWRTASVRSLIYHSVPSTEAGGFERQVQYFARHFHSATFDDLAGLLRDGTWNHSKPGLLLTFDDGLRSHAEVAAPILEKYGFCGWFFVPMAFVDAASAAQREFAVKNRIVHFEDLPGERIAMTWDQARALAEKHVVGGHTATHVRLSADLTPQDLQREIPDAKAYLEAKLGKPVDSMAWVGGEEWSYSRSAAEAIRDAGFNYSFMTNSAPITRRADPLQLERTRVEPHWPLSMVRWQLAGMMDPCYAAKRRRVHRLTKTATA